MAVSLPTSKNERKRLDKFQEYYVAHVADGSPFDRLAGLAAQLFNAPIALISIIGEDTLFLKGKTGIQLCEIDRETSFCTHAILGDDILFVPDATQDPQFQQNPYVMGAPFVRFYAGLALRAPTGEAIGSICVIDQLPRVAFTDTDRRNLTDLAGLAMAGLELTRINKARHDTQPWFQNVAATAPDAIFCADRGNGITFWNRAAEQLFGYTRADIHGRPVAEIVPGLAELLQTTTGRNRIEEKTTVMTCLRRDGSPFSAEVGVSSWSEGESVSVGAIVRDITERREREDRLFQLASLDALTGLPNRAAWRDCLAEVVVSEESLTLLLFDLDGFKGVNDTLGHVAGDMVLKQVGERLRQICRSAVMVARLGGDEFVCLLRGDNLRCAQGMARDVINAIATPIHYDGNIIQIGASVGISLHPQHSSDPDDLMEAADLALYRAKMAGKGGFELFTADMKNVARLRQVMEEDLRKAFAQGEFELFYQPQFTTTDRKLAGAEALLRWNHPERGLMTPAAFIDVLGKMPLSLSVGEWILETACRNAAAWRQVRPDFQISANLFASQFQAGRLLAAIRRVLGDTGLPPTALEVEIVENILTNQDGPIIKSLQDLRKMGVGLAFDDYGTGFASLSLLKRYPASRLKIDQSFVRDVGQDPENAAVVKVILYLAKVFGMDVIAEGIETEDQLTFLAEHGCPQGQGFLFGHPVPAHEFFTLYIDPAP